MNLIKKITKDNNFLSLFGNVTYSILGFVSFIILTRSFEKEIFGEWVLYVAGGVFIEMIRFGLTKTAIVRYLSGADEDEAQKLMGSNWMIGLVITIIIASLLLLTRLLFDSSIQNSGYKQFFNWYPLLAFINLPMNNAITLLQAKQQFQKIVFIRLFANGTFVLILLANLFWLKIDDIRVAIFAHISMILIASIICMVYNWDGIKYIRKASKEINKKILDFGKFSIGTLIGSNLLKSADTFIIGLSSYLGTAAVALYSVPLKLTDILDVPLRSFVFTAYPKMSKASIANDLEKVRTVFYEYAGAMTLIFIPFIIIAFIFSKYFILILGGEQYLEATNIFRIFCIYSLFLPIDRFTGVALDAINLPKKNFFKIIYMAGTNVVGDLIAIFVLRLIFPSIPIISILMWVASVTIIITIIGQFVGLHYLNKEIKINYLQIFKSGIWIYKKGFNILKGHIK